MEIIVFLATIFVGFFGSAIFGTLLNWPDAGAVVAIAFIGSLIMRSIRTVRDRLDKKDTEDK